MKELDNFTVERLEEITELKALSFPPSHHELAALARIALAAKRAEPVAWVVGDEEIADFKNGREVCVMRDCDDEQLDYLPLYTTPQLNPPQGWIKCSDQMPEDDTLCLGVDEDGVIWTMYFDGEFRADTGWPPDLNVTHWMTLPAAPEKGNG
ncbi:Protein of uncharacterised function (DUF551) [Yersinia intermedia]|uniref:DUF551 domain-containing protein n=1 Tax=Yersinia intermedia TaxID=631 RepID=UPI0005E94EEC|nr:DUF551 domain-containing protein [Yersinia intermedia]CNI86290.1 Protein of uncharacterised function (DUF551) [Yersinia intermedia]